MGEAAAAWKANQKTFVNQNNYDRETINNLSEGKSIEEIDAASGKTTKLYYNENDRDIAFRQKGDEDTNNNFLNAAHGTATNTSLFVTSSAHEYAHNYTSNEAIAQNAGQLAGFMWGLGNALNFTSVNTNGNATSTSWYANNQNSSLLQNNTAMANSIASYNRDSLTLGGISPTSIGPNLGLGPLTTPIVEPAVKPYVTPITESDGQPLTTPINEPDTQPYVTPIAEPESHVYVTPPAEHNPDDYILKASNDDWETYLNENTGYRIYEYEGTTKVGGVEKDVSRRVYQLNDIDPNRIDPKTGQTNLELMKQGKSPYTNGGMKVELHHTIQSEPGPVVEIPSGTHQQYTNMLHGLVQDGESFRNDPNLEKQYDNFRDQYWKEQAKEFETGGRK